MNATNILSWFFVLQFREHRLALAPFGLVFAASAVYGLYMYWCIFSDRQKEAQDGLLFVALPLDQAGGALAKVIAKLRG
jgi:hypothetical protein